MTGVFYTCVSLSQRDVPLKNKKKLFFKSESTPEYDVDIFRHVGVFYLLRIYKVH